MRQIEISLPPNAADAGVEQAIDDAIARAGLRVTMRGTLKQFPGCIHWHAKNGRAPGTLEITYWPAEHRAWISIQEGRKGDWIEGQLKPLQQAISARK